MMELQDFREAEDVLKKVIVKTPLERCVCYDGCNEVYVKPENRQVTGAYKVRGAYYKISRMGKDALERGIVTSSAGNHAQGVAYAARGVGAKAVVVMPVTTPLVKVNNTKKFGATVALHGDCYDDAYAYALRLSEAEGYTFVHPFDDLEIATGQGTIAGEILAELPDADIILVPIGGGGLAAGVSTYAKLVNPDVNVIGVEPTGAACMAASLRAGRVVCLDSLDTIAEGVAVKRPGDLIFPYIQKNLDGVILVEDTAIPDAFLDMAENHKMIVENAGLLPLVALKQLGVKGKKIVCLLSGGNMDVLNMPTLVSHGLIHRGRVFTLSITLADKPGELANTSRIIGELRGNIIRVEHNQFVYINRNAAVELRLTVEAFGHEHKREIMRGLEAAGYTSVECAPKAAW